MADPTRRLYASPLLSNTWSTPDPNQTPGFSVQPDTASQTNPMASMLASFMPSQQALKQGVADTLGAPVDGLAWALHMMGLPSSGDESYGGGTFNRAPGSGQGIRFVLVTPKRNQTGHFPAGRCPPN